MDRTTTEQNPQLTQAIDMVKIWLTRISTAQPALPFTPRRISIDEKPSTSNRWLTETQEANHG